MSKPPNYSGYPCNPSDLPFKPSEQDLVFYFQVRRSLLIARDALEEADRYAKQINDEKWRERALKEIESIII